MATSAREVMTGDAKCVQRGRHDPDRGRGPRQNGSRRDADLRQRQPAQGHAHRPGHNDRGRRKGKDPESTKVSELANGKPVTIGADDSVEEALQTMKDHQVRRLPVIDGHDLIGIVSQADVARNLPDEKVGDLLEAISRAEPRGDHGHDATASAPSARGRFCCSKALETLRTWVARCRSRLHGAKTTLKTPSCFFWNCS